MRRVLSDLSERLAGVPLLAATLKEYGAQWLERKRLEIGGVSFSAYKTAVNEFIEHTPQKATAGIQYVTVTDIAAYRDKAATTASPNTANNKLKVLRALFQSAWRDGYITDNPAAKVSKLKAEESNRRPFTLPELKKLLGVASAEWRGMILVGLYTGQRLKDIATLNWSSVDLARKEVALTTSKTKRRQIIPLAKALEAFFADYPASDDPRAPVFPHAAAIVVNDGDVSRLSQQFYEILVTAGLAAARLPKEKSKGIGRKARRERSDITFHSLRHTATSLLKNAGVSEAVARDIIGHDSEQVSRHYTHIDEDAKRAAFEKLPDLFSEQK